MTRVKELRDLLDAVPTRFRHELALVSGAVNALPHLLHRIADLEAENERMRDLLREDYPLIDMGANQRHEADMEEPRP